MKKVLYALNVPSGFKDGKIEGILIPEVIVTALVRYNAEPKKILCS